MTDLAAIAAEIESLRPTKAEYAAMLLRLVVTYDNKNAEELREVMHGARNLLAREVA